MMACFQHMVHGRWLDLDCGMAGLWSSTSREDDEAALDCGTAGLGDDRRCKELGVRHCNLKEKKRERKTDFSDKLVFKNWSWFAGSIGLDWFNPVSMVFGRFVGTGSS